MWWMLGSAAVAAAGKVIYDVLTDDEGSSSSSSSDKAERQADAIREARRDAKRKILKKIHRYQQQQKEYLESKYRCQFTWLNERKTEAFETVWVSFPIFGQSENLTEYELVKNKDIEGLIEQLSEKKEYVRQALMELENDYGKNR